MTGITAVDEKKENFSFFSGSNDTAKGPECAKCPLGESRKYIVKEGTELGCKLPPSFVKKGTELVINLSTSLGIHATAKEIAKSYLMISLTSSE